MSKKNDDVIVYGDFDEGEIDFRRKPSARQFDGDDDQVIDADTGESEFDDIDPRFRNPVVNDDAPEDDDEDFDDEEDTSRRRAADEDDLDEDDLGEEDEDERPRKGRRDKFRARLERERRLREEEREDNRELRTRLSQLEASLNARADEETFAQAKAGIEQKIASVREQLHAATEAGIVADQVRLTEELADLKADLRHQTGEHERAKAAAAEAAKKPATENAIVVRKVRQWMRKHPRYHTDQEFSAAVKANDRILASEGYDPETSEYYEELDKRLSRRFPEEYPKARAERDTSRRRQHPSANIRRGNERPAAQGDFKVRNGRITLTPRQIANMRAFHLDPNDPEDRKAYYENNRNNRSR